MVPGVRGQRGGNEEGQKRSITAPWDPGVQGSQADQEHLACPAEGQNAIRKDKSHYSAQKSRPLPGFFGVPRVPRVHLCTSAPRSPQLLLPHLQVHLPQNLPLYYPARPLSQASPLPEGEHQPSSSLRSFLPSAPSTVLPRRTQSCCGNTGSAAHSSALPFMGFRTTLMSPQ